MILLEGRDIKNKVIDEIKDKVSKLDRVPTLAVISTIENNESKMYLNSKKKMCEKVGYDYRYFDCTNMEEEEIISLISKLNHYDDIDGILLQLPLREDINSNKVINSIDYKKDVDGITDINMGKLVNHNSYLYSCTALGIIKLLESYSIDIKGKNVVIIGRSRLVGKPLAHLFLNMDATVCLCHSKTDNLEFYTRNADIVVVAVNQPNFLNCNMIKKDSIIVDVGIHKLENGSIVGDVDFHSVEDKVSYITPVPGGVGQMTVAMLCQNIFKAYLERN